MRSHSPLFSLIALASALAAAALPGCGAKKTEELSKKAMNALAARSGCLNTMDARFRAFAAGDITESEWSDTWNCAIDALEMFKGYIRGSAPNGYTSEDLRAFVSHFLLTGREVTPELMKATFDFKASVLGGTREVLTYDEISKVIDLFRVTERGTVGMIPLLRARTARPSTAQLIALSDSLQRLANQIADRIQSEGNLDFSRQSVEVIGAELARLFNWKGGGTGAPAWLGTGKSLLLGGRTDTMEGALWPRAFRLMGSLGGPAVAGFSAYEELQAGGQGATLFRGLRSLREDGGGEIEKGGLVDSLAERVRQALRETVAWHGGNVPLSKLDDFIDTLPDEWVTTGKAPLKLTLRPLLLKIFGSQSPDALDGETLDRAFQFLAEWNQRQNLLEEIYSILNAGTSGVTPEEFTEAAMRLMDRLDEAGRGHLQALIEIANRYRPLFLGNDPQITLTTWNRISLFHMTQMNWIRLVAQKLMRVYSTPENPTRINFEGFSRVFSDFRELGAALGGIDKLVPDFDRRRFREANLFTFNSNGDDWLDLDEATYFIAFLYSAGTLTQRMQAAIDQDCPSLGPDHMRGHYMEIACAQRALYSRWETLWDHFPGLLEHYRSLSDKDRRRLTYAMERAARPFGVKDAPWYTSDLQGLAALPHYLEAFFARMDRDNSQVLDKQEALSGAAVFHQTLYQQGGLTNDRKLTEAIFTYTVHHGRAPGKNFKDVSLLVGWMIARPFWKIQEPRLNLYRAIGSFNDPSSPDEPPTP